MTVTRIGRKDRGLIEWRRLVSFIFLSCTMCALVLHADGSLGINYQPPPPPPTTPGEREKVESGFSIIKDTKKLALTGATYLPIRFV